LESESKILEPGENETGTSHTVRRMTLFAYGFRPFFLLAGIYAALVIPLWMALIYGADLPMVMPPPAWHVHEMLFGFIAAAVAGFLLTAVPSWTGNRGYAGRPLVVLVLLWLAGRVVVSLPTGLPLLWVGIIDLAFIPALALTVMPALIRSGNRRNLVFFVLLALLFATNLEFHYRGAVSNEPLMVTINIMLFMVVMVGGRILPAFTSSALKSEGFDVRISRFAPLDNSIPVVIASIIVIDRLAPASRYAGFAAALATMLLVAQLIRWQTWRSWRSPILWVLHLAYTWLAVGLLLKSVWIFGLAVPAMSWLHALTVGAFSTMILGVMSRVSLGHTGRKLIAPGMVVVAYLLLTLAAILRVFGPIVVPAAWSWSIIGASVLWSAAFVLFVIRYTPILCSPRVDGKPG
jgi:uncharacterized protein involved in response to NO